MKYIKLGLIFGIFLAFHATATDGDKDNFKQPSKELVLDQPLSVESELDEHLNNDITNTLKSIKQKSGYIKRK